jgi:hypothetical protein
VFHTSHSSWINPASLSHKNRKLICCGEIMFSASFGLQLLLLCLCLLSVFHPTVSNYKQAKYFSFVSQGGEEYPTYNKKKEG